VTLPCFTGGEPVALNRLGRPAMINLWASWCWPCRDELPAFQAFADEAGDEVLVLGVVTDDGRNGAASLATDLGVHFPAVFDAHRELQSALGRTVLPVTVLVASDGSVRATDVSGALTLEKLRALATEHLGYAP
jgi:thiol-disulfide isomerase/thioredoxin